MKDRLSNKKLQTPAEKYLIDKIKSSLNAYYKQHNNIPRLLNIGSGKSVVIEKQLLESGLSFVCDRVEIEKVQASGYCIRNCYECSVEAMYPIKSGEYHAIFANYVLEHIQFLDKCASEIYRVLQPGGIFVASIPNPSAPEFLIADLTPLWFHRLIRRKEAWETHYAFGDIRKLSTIFQRSGFAEVEIFYRSCIERYLKKFILLKYPSRLYDSILNTLQFKRFMDDICIVFKKPIVD